MKEKKVDMQYLQEYLEKFLQKFESSIDSLNNRIASLEGLIQSEEPGASLNYEVTYLLQGKVVKVRRPSIITVPTVPPIFTVNSVDYLLSDQNIEQFLIAYSNQMQSIRVATLDDYTSPVVASPSTTEKEKVVSHRDTDSLQEIYEKKFDMRLSKSKAQIYDAIINQTPINVYYYDKGDEEGSILVFEHIVSFLEKMLRRIGEPQKLNPDYKLAPRPGRPQGKEGDRDEEDRVIFGPKLMLDF